MTTEWAHLPNAKHIDAVLAHAKAHPKKWDEAWDATCRDASWISARDASWNEARNKAWIAAWDAAWDAAQNAAQNAILALVAYDDCAYLLDSTPDELRLISALSGDANPAAVLLLPAVIAFHKELAPA